MTKERATISSALAILIDEQIRRSEIKEGTMAWAMDNIRLEYAIEILQIVLDTGMFGYG